jgi:hypothetical protein
MKKAILAGVLIVTAAWSSAVHTQAPPCTPIGQIQFICDVRGPEDFALVPGSPWVLVSGNQAGLGQLRALHPGDKKVVPVFPSPTVKFQLDAKAFPACPGPINLNDPGEKKTVAFHGLYLRPGTESTHRLFTVHHGARESIEAFDVDSKASPPSLTWVGCVVAPANAVFNSMVAFADGGVAATNTPRPPAGQPPPNVRVGQVWAWHAATGWAAVPGTEGVSINGLEVSKDEKLLYVSSWGEQTMLRVERGVANPKRDVLHMPFRIDNLRMMGDGSILAAGHAGKALCSCLGETWHIGRIDPRGAMSVALLLSEPYVPGFGAATVAAQVGKEIWIGTNRGDRIGYFPAP